MILFILTLGLSFVSGLVFNHFCRLTLMEVACGGVPCFVMADAAILLGLLLVKEFANDCSFKGERCSLSSFVLDSVLENNASINQIILHIY